MEKFELTVYAVRNQEGKWFHAIGYGGSGSSWCDDFKKARIFSNLSGARSRVTYFANKWPQYGIPEIVEFTLSSSRVLSEKERIEAAALKKKIAKEKADVQRKMDELKRAKAALEEAQQRLKKAESNL